MMSPSHVRVTSWSKHPSFDLVHWASIRPPVGYKYLHSYANNNVFLPRKKQVFDLAIASRLHH